MCGEAPNTQLSGQIHYATTIQRGQELLPYAMSVFIPGPGEPQAGDEPGPDEVVSSGGI